jgi:hydrogenase maturation protease
MLGCGNLSRSDDAAGLLVRGARPVDNPLDLIEAWAGHEEAIVVDAVVTGAPPGTILEWDAIAKPLPAIQFRCSTHAFGIAEAVELARVLGRLPQRLTIYGIEAANFEPGGAPSPEVLAAVDRLASRLEQAGENIDRMETVREAQ